MFVIQLWKSLRTVRLVTFLLIHSLLWNDKDLGPSQENGNDEKDFNAISREKGRYKSCHLFLSGDDSSPVSVASSPENVSFFFSF